jgi:ATP-dependent RNA helicase DeaD
MTTSGDETETPTTSSFAALGLDARLVAALATLGYEEPTPIQRAAIPALLAGKDLLGQAETGTGKTAAFALPLLHHLAQATPAPGRRAPRALVLVPTRELAMQVAEAIGRYGQGLGLRVVAIYGGQSFEPQLGALKRGVDVVVATPGRALDHLRRRTLQLGAVSQLVLDEADEMLDMGFAEDLAALLAEVPAAPARQTALFSATMPAALDDIVAQHLHRPARVQIAAKVKAGAAPRVRQVAYLVTRATRLPALLRVLELEDPAAALVFCRTRVDVDELVLALTRRGQAAEALHGGLSQEQRDRVMKRFRAGEMALLVATDVAARGLDIKGLSHVFNYEIPTAPEDYVHRIGRTGRAGREGVAITLVEAREQRLLHRVEQLTRQKIELAPVPGAEALRAHRLERLRRAAQAAQAAGGLERFRAVAAQLAEGADALDVAAATLKLAHDTRTGAAAEDELELAPPPPRPREERERERGRGRGPERPERAAAAPAPVGADAARLWIGLGRQAGVRPADLVGAIANEAGLSSRDIRVVEIAVRHSLVEVPAMSARGVMQALSRTLLRGRKVAVRIART